MAVQTRVLTSALALAVGFLDFSSSSSHARVGSSFQSFYMVLPNSGPWQSQTQATQPDNLVILRDSDDPAKLENAAIALIQSESPSDMEAVLRSLVDPAFLFRLDSKESYQFSKEHLRIRRLLFGIARLPSKHAVPALLRLGKSEAFVDDSYRRTTFMWACVELKTPSEKLFDLLDALGTDDSGHLTIKVRVLAHMRSPEACSRIEKHFATLVNPHRDWFEDFLLDLRNEPVILDLYKALLTKHVKDAQVADRAIRTLFDDKAPKHNIADLPEKVLPPRRAAPIKALEKLLELADLVLRMDISEETKRIVVEGRSTAKEILEFEKSGKPQEIEKLINQLDDNNFSVREKARVQLEQFGIWAETRLRSALKDNPTLELRLRIEQLLNKIETNKK